MFALLAASLNRASLAPAATILLKDGRTMTGELGQTSGVADDPFQPGPSAGQVRTTPIVIVDDGLRRTYLRKTSVAEVLDEADPPTIRLPVWQNHAENGSALGVVGQPINVTPFDEFGRRLFEMPTRDGSIAVVQGITEVQPVYTRIRGLRAKPKSYIWDMRIATSSLPRDVLTRVLENAVPRTDLDERIKVVQLYVQSERYRDARKELEQILVDFAGDPAAEQFGEFVDELRRLAAKSLLREIELRRKAGQHQLVRTLLERFPSEGVDGSTLQRVRELLDQDDLQIAKRKQLLTALEKTIENLAEPSSQKVGKLIFQEIEEHLTEKTAERLAAFRQLSDGAAAAGNRGLNKGSGQAANTILTAEELAAVAISGWLVGSDRAVDNLPVALSLVSVRNNVRRYLAEQDKMLRESLLVEIRDTSATTVPRVAELLRLIEPPLPLPENAIGPGCYDLTEQATEADAPALNNPAPNSQSPRVIVQLPPEYDPLSSYPTIVTLPPIGVKAEAQLNFWAGAPRNVQGQVAVGRGGQAMRRGYIVIAIEWAQQDQLRYQYSAREHAVVLSAVRDAMRRLAIDPDRVYLTGHGKGGDAAWDIALAHPDAWAGVMPFLAVANRYCGWYWENAKYVPWLLVNGELDAGKVARNSRELDRYLKPNFDATIVEYRGRGYDPLNDELQRAFDWMGRKVRGAPPQEFECATLRPWDNYFWWAEVEGLPKKAITPPATWPPKRGTRAAKIRGRKYTDNKLGIFARTDKLTVWLSPELVDFDQPVEIEWDGRRITERGKLLEPELETLLEDTRSRADRYRPYWVKIEATR